MTMKRLIKMCADIADGMMFLSEKEVVHRDLAARNCLVSKPPGAPYETVKICDFGMTRELDIEEFSAVNKMPYYVPTEANFGEFPLRWWPPEAIEPPNKFTTESDIWSYGVLLYEIGSLGETPYGTEENGEIKKRLSKDRARVQEYNVLCKNEWRKLIIDNLGFLGISEKDTERYIIGLIQTCCVYEIAKRPDFQQILRRIDEIAEYGDLAKYEDEYYFFSERDELIKEEMNEFEMEKSTFFIEDEEKSTDIDEEINEQNDKKPLLP